MQETGWTVENKRFWVTIIRLSVLLRQFGGAKLITVVFAVCWQDLGLAKFMGGPLKEWLPGHYRHLNPQCVWDAMFEIATNNIEMGC